MCGWKASWSRRSRFVGDRFAQEIRANSGRFTLRPGGCRLGFGGGDGNSSLMAAGYHVVFHNLGGTFDAQKQACPMKTDPSISGTVSVAADVDRDGDLDLLIESSPGILTLWQNDTPEGNHWLEVQPESTKVALVGALVQVGSNGHVLERSAERRGGYGSHQAQSARFGLGSVAKLELVRIWWPTGHVTELHHVSVDEVLRVQQPKKQK